MSDYSRFSGPFFLILSLAFLFPSLLFKGLSGQEKSKDKTKIEKKLAQKSIPQLIRELGDSNWKVREEATEELRRRLPKSRPFLQKALLHSDPEVRWRAEKILHVSLAQVVYRLSKKIAPSGGYGYYEGQFDDLKKDRELLAGGLIEIVKNPKFFSKITSEVQSPYRTRVLKRYGKNQFFDDKIRYLAVQAVGDLKIKGAEEALKKIYRDKGRLSTSAACSLSKIGNRKYVEELIKSLNHLIRRDPKETRYYTRLAQLYRNLNKLDKTIETYQRAIPKTKDKNDLSLLYYNLACAYASNKEKKKALDALEQAVVKHGYDDRDWMKEDGDLNYIKKTAKFRKLLKIAAKNARK